MDRQPVQSSNIMSVGYDQEKKLLEVEFKNGHIYEYSDVTIGQYELLKAAPSIGSFLAKDIRPWHPVRKVNV